MKNLVKNLSALAIFAFIFYIFVSDVGGTGAWTGPQNPAPGGNISAPINVGLGYQERLGPLVINASTSTPASVGLNVFGKSVFWDSVESKGDVCGMVNGVSLCLDDIADSLVVFKSNTGASGTQYSWRGTANNDEGNIVLTGASSGPIYISNDYGNNWSQMSNYGNKGWYDIAVSSTGSRIYATLSNLSTGYTSSDSGATWSTFNLPFAQNKIKTNGDGSVLVAIDYGGLVYKSTNLGSNFSVINSTARNYEDIDISKSGSTIVTVAYTGRWYISANGGSTWTVDTSATNRDWVSVAVSDMGTLAAGVSKTRILVTTNAALTALAAQGPTASGSKYWTGIDMSSDGRRMVASQVAGRLHVSNDYGITWSPIGPTGDFTEVTMSSTGGIIYATDSENGVTVILNPEV